MVNIIFDLDGTLIDSAPGVTWSLNCALKTAGREQLTVEQTIEFIGWGADHLVYKALKQTGGIRNKSEPDKIKKHFLKIYRENPIKNTTIFPGALEVLKTLQDKRFPLALCTNKPKKMTLLILKKLELFDFFSVVCCGEDVKHPKPDGRHILETLTFFNNIHPLSVMIGDSENDILAANDAGILSILTTFGYCHQPYKDLSPTAMLDDFSEFFDILKSLEELHALS